MNGLKEHVVSPMTQSHKLNEQGIRHLTPENHKDDRCEINNSPKTTIHRVGLQAAS